MSKLRLEAKENLKKLLRAAGIKVSKVQKGSVAGTDLATDLSLVVRKNSPLCLDVGANQGQTIALFNVVFNDPDIYAFEPSQKIFRQLDANYSSARVQVYNLALGSSPGEKEFINYEDPCLSSFLRLEASPENRFRQTSVRGHETVVVDTIDRFVSREKLGLIDLLKIDTQGYDFEVLKGASGALKNGLIQNVLVELNFIPMYEGQGSSTEILEFLSMHGLRLVDFYEKFREGRSLAWCTALFHRPQDRGVS